MVQKKKEDKTVSTDKENNGFIVPADPRERQSLDRIYALLLKSFHVDFTHYRHTTILRRMSRRMKLNKKNNFLDYLKYLKKNSSEINMLYDDLLLSFTEFFRDPNVFDILKTKLFPILTAGKSVRTPIRIWIPGCSTGEEVYSLAISLYEFLEETKSKIPVQFFGTDLMERHVDKARSGLYPLKIKKDISKERLKKFFDKTKEGYRVIRHIREMCVFAVQDIIQDPPFPNIDLVSCRNVLIYFDDDFQSKTIPLFHFSLNPKGFLLLGTSETLGSFHQYFDIIDSKVNLYSKRNTETRPEYSFPVNRKNSKLKEIEKNIASSTNIKTDNTDIKEKVNDILIDTYSPPGVIVDYNLQIIQFIGHTFPYLRQESGKASLKLKTMADSSLMPDLYIMIEEVKRKKKKIRSDNIVFKHHEISQTLNISVIPVSDQNSEETNFLILFEKVEIPQKTISKHASGSKDDNVISNIKEELLSTKDHLKLIVEEKDRINQALWASNEEVQSTNEELQSVNEEMEASKEELESGNEELKSLNEELKEKNIKLENSEERIIKLNQLRERLLSGSLTMKLRSVTKGLVNIMDADFARIWLIKHGDLCNSGCKHSEINKNFRLCNKNQQKCLHLMSSSGRYTHIDGIDHKRIPVGYYKVGLIASGNKSEFFTNNVVNDRSIKEQKWAEELGLTSFAGYQLKSSDGTLVGVIALFSKKKLSSEEREVIQAIANSASEVIIADNALELLKESEEQFRTLMEQSLLPIQIYDIDGFMIKANKAWIELWDVKNIDKVLGNYNLLTDSQNEQLGLIDEFKKVYNGAKIDLQNIMFDPEVSGHSGRLRYVNISSYPLKARDGSFRYVVVFNEDVTERTIAENSLRESEKRFRDIADSMADWIWEVNTKMEFTYCSDNSKYILGYTPEELIGKTPFDIVCPEEIEKLKKVSSIIIKQKGFLENIENWYNKKDGKSVCILTNGAPILNNKNDLIGYRGVGNNITRRKRNEKALIASQEQYRTLYDNVPVGLFRSSPEGKLLSVNKVIVDLFGYESAEEFMNISTPELYSDPEVRKTLFSEIMKKGSIENFEILIKQKNGTNVWMSTSIHATFDKNNTLLFLDGMVKDITVQKQTAEALLESENNLRTIFNSMTDIVFEMDYNGKYLTIAPTSPDLMFKPPEDMIGKTLHDAFPEQEANIFLAFIRKSLDENIINTIEYPLTINEKTVWFEGRATPKTKNSVLYIARDITASKSAAEELKESEKKFRILIEQSNDCIYLLFNNKFEMINSRFEKLFGYSLQDCQKEDFNFIQLVAPESIPIIEGRIEKVKRGEELEPIYEFTAISKNGKKIECEVSVSYIDYKGSKAAQGIIRDISERKQASEDKARLEKQLRRAQKLETIGTMAGGIAHDFNNILAPIMGYTEMALYKLDEEDQLYHDLQNVLKGTHRAKELVEQILLFSKQSEKEHKSVSLQSQVKEALKLLRPTIPTTIEINLKLDDSCPKIMGDATQMHQVIINLCNNAWQAMEDRGGILNIELALKKIDANFAKLHSNFKESEYVCLSITDTGIGMNEQTVDRIFEPFFTTKEVNKGTGLGLSVVHGIIRSHKGEIIVNSEPDKGTAINIYLPVLKTEDKLEKSKSKMIIGGNEHIMIVDDEPLVLEMVRTMLSSFGYKAKAFDSATDALKAFKHEPDTFDLLLTDLTMPEMTGLELSDQIHKKNHLFPVIIMTGYGNTLDEYTLAKHFIKKVIAKPILIKELTDSIRKVLDD